MTTASSSWTRLVLLVTISTTLMDLTAGMDCYQCWQLVVSSEGNKSLAEASASLLTNLTCGALCLGDGDPPNWPSIKCTGGCFKIRAKVGDIGQVYRGCYTRPQLNEYNLTTGYCKNTSTVGGVEGVACICDGDLCNEAGGLNLSLGMMVVVGAVAGVVSWLSFS